MGVSVYPVFNKEVIDFDVAKVSGKVLADVIFEEGSIFEPLLRFSSDNEDELKDFISSQTGQDIAEIEVPAEKWFSPKEGLQIVQPLLELVRSNPQPPIAVPQGWDPAEFAEGLADDLASLEGALVLAQEHKALFHLALDF